MSETDPAARAVPVATVAIEDDRLVLGGDWTVVTAAGIRRELARLEAGKLPAVIDARGIRRLDTAGALVLERLCSGLARGGGEPTLLGLQPLQAELLARVRELRAGRSPLRVPGVSPLVLLGQGLLDGLVELQSLVHFLGEITLRMGWLMLHPGRIRWRALFTDLYEAGVGAVGIVGLISFLMGIVIAYQGAVQLRVYGANIYVADLVGLSMVRELSPLLTAIIVAGRTGSAYAAQIGTMQVTEEVAALKTIGILPLDVLVLPKLLSLFIALPLLVIFADVLGVLGGMVMSKVILGLGFEPFLNRLHEALSLRSYLIGVLKSPIFALIIAVVGCFQGFCVQGGAEAVGRHTTLSVVQSIFLVIIADAAFSILFSWLGI